MITENLSTLKIHKLTQAQYDRELANGNIDENALYLTPDEGIDLSGYATVEQLNAKADAEHSHGISDVTNLQTSLDELLEEAKTYTDTIASGKSDSNHNHDDIYYTETEIDTKLSGKSDNTHNHDSDYDAKGSADTALDSAKAYTDTKTSDLASTAAVETKINTHNTETSAHNDIRDLISGLTTRLNALADSDDTTLDQMSEIVAYIKSNKELIDSITTTKVNVADIIDNLITNVSNKPLSAAQGVALKSLIDNLEKADVGLGNVDNTSDADKPVSTAQAAAIDEAKQVGIDAQNNLNSHTGNKNNPHGVTAAQVGARPDTWMPTAADVGADPAGSATSAVSSHNTSTSAHADIRTAVATAQERADSAYELANGKAASSHNHDDRYYTEAEVDSKLSGKANSSHGNHVPATETANNAKFLRNDNTWQTVTPANIGAVPTTRTVNGKALSSNISLTAADVGASPANHTHTGYAPMYTYGTEDLVVGESELPAGQLYFVIE